MHVSREPAILYFGTPVVLVATTNEDGTPNLSPMSSAFWLGWRCMLGLDSSSQTTRNLLRTGQCVLNLPSQAQAAAVNRLALSTGASPVPPLKKMRGYRHVADKFALAGLTPQPSETVAPPRVLECPVQLEAVLGGTHPLAQGDGALEGYALALEVRIQRVHLEESLLAPGAPNRIDPDRWRPLIMSFQKFYGLDAGQLHGSALGTVPEAMYRSPDVDRARLAVSSPHEESAVQASE